MDGIHHLTNEELIAQLSVRDDLTMIEHELLDRLIRATDEVGALQQAEPACNYTGRVETIE